ncbi:MAG: GHKL domain-containing protein [Clostridia bacterium]
MMANWFPVEKETDLTFVITVLLSVTIELLISRERFSKTLFFLLAYVQAFTIVLCLSGFLAGRFYQEYDAAKCVIRTLMHLALAVLCVAVSKGKLRRFLQGLDGGWWPLNFLAGLLLIYLSGVSLRVYRTAYGREEILFFTLLLPVIVAVYGVFFHMIHLMYNASEKQRAELQSRFLLRQVQNMQESIAEARRIRHDARHHNLQIQEYLQQKEYDALLSYLGAYEQDAQDEQLVRICDNLAANSILSAYARKARQNGISVHLDVTMDRDMGISDMDIVAILANLMENAIYGCAQSGSAHQTMDVYIGRKVKKLVIYVRNSASKDVVFENGLPKSQSGGGIGVTSILHCAARYGGEYDFRNEDGQFACQILLKIPEPSREAQ